MKRTADIWEEIELPRRLKMTEIAREQAIIEEWHELSDIDDDED